MLAWHGLEYWHVGRILRVELETGERAYSQNRRKGQGPGEKVKV